MNQIIVGFSRPSGWFEPFSWLIRLVCWTPYSHVYIKFYSQSYDRWLVYQASGLKVNFVGDAMFNGEETLCGEFEIPITTKALTETIQFSIDNCGAPYGVSQILGFPWVLLMNLFGKRVKNPFYNGSSWFCSELVAQILNNVKSVGDKMDPSTATPKDVYDFIISKGYKQLASS